MITGIDHIALTVDNIDKSIFFYRNVLGMTLKKFRTVGKETIRYSLNFGNQKINLHDVKFPFTPHANNPLPGATDICFLSSLSIKKWQSILLKNNIIIEDGPVEKTGATGKILSLYVKDPDKNLIEISNRI